MISIFEWLLGRYSPLGISSFEQSSMIKIVVFRGFGTTVDPLEKFVGQHQGKVIDLLENSEYNVRCLDAFMMKTDNLIRCQF